MRETKQYDSIEELNSSTYPSSSSNIIDDKIVSSGQQQLVTEKWDKVKRKFKIFAFSYLGGIFLVLGYKSKLDELYYDPNMVQVKQGGGILGYFLYGTKVVLAVIPPLEWTISLLGLGFIPVKIAPIANQLRQYMEVGENIGPQLQMFLELAPKISIITGAVFYYFIP